MRRAETTGLSSVERNSDDPNRRPRSSAWPGESRGVDSNRTRQIPRGVGLSRWSWVGTKVHFLRPASAACDGYSMSFLRTGGSPGPRTRSIRTSLSTTVKIARYVRPRRVRKRTCRISRSQESFSVANWASRAQSSEDRVPGRVAPGDCSPGAPTDPYEPSQTYVSAYHELARGRLPE